MPALEGRGPSLSGALLVIATSLLVACGLEKVPDGRPGPPPGGPDAVAGDASGSAGRPSAGPDARGADLPGGPPTVVGPPPEAGVDILSMQASGSASIRPRKGDPLRLAFTVRNHEQKAVEVELAPVLEADGLPGFGGVPLPPTNARLAPGEERQVVVTAGPLLVNPERRAHYALTTGSYTVSAVWLSWADQPARRDASFGGGSFSVEAGPAVLMAVAHDPAYFEHLRVPDNAGAFVAQALSRPAEVFWPDSARPEMGRFEAFPGGLVGMLGVRAALADLPGFRASETAPCERLREQVGELLGLSRPWDASLTPSPNNHGFDAVLALSPQIDWGMGCPGALAIAGLPPSDASILRAQLLINFAAGAIFGAQSCLPLQGFVMCAGHLHPRYQAQGLLVWHQRSRLEMRNPFTGQ